MSYKLVSEYIISYITKNGDSEMLKSWNDKEFKKLFKNKNKLETTSTLKKNKSAYVLFSNEERENIKKEGITLNNKETISELAKRWNKIKTSEDVDDKKIFEKFSSLAAQDKERYNTENGKSNQKVKKNMSSYMYYCKDERENIKKEKDLKLNNKEIVTELARRWKIFKSSENKKDKQKLQKYTKMAEEDKERYTSEKEISNKNSVTNSVNVEASSEAADTESNIDEKELEDIPEPETVVEKKKSTKKKTKK